MQNLLIYLIRSCLGLGVIRQGKIIQTLDNFTWLMSAISWRGGTQRLKFVVEGNSLGYSEMISLGSTRPLTNSSCALRNSKARNEINPALMRALFSTASKPSDCPSPVILYEAFSANSKASSIRSLSNKYWKNKITSSQCYCCCNISKNEIVGRKSIFSKKFPPFFSS